MKVSHTQLIIMLCVLLWPAIVLAEDDIAYFEKYIRPVLLDKCYSCHSAQAKSVKGGLYLDSKAGILQGGDSGSAIDLHSPSKSLLLQVLKYDSEIKMPPRGKLPEQIINHFETWIKNGAADPRTETTLKNNSRDLSRGKA